ncbi:Prolyl oligopeptidase family protein [Streptomyces sp. ADI96-02]|nr:Prolyl oligopeptidase family protein [Streptomyces sp. ADI96-02]
MKRRPERLSFRFSERSRYAACLVTAADGGLVPGWWDLDGTGPRYREGSSAESTATQVLPTEDGGLLRLRGAAGSGRHLLMLSHPTETADLTETADPAGTDGAEDAGERTAVEARGLRLVAGGPQDVLALAVETDPHGRTRVWQVRPAPLRLTDPVALPGRVGGLLPLDATGRRYATDLAPDGRYRPGLGRTDDCRPVVLDLRDRTWHPLASPAGGRVHRLLLSLPGSGALLAAADAGDGRLRIARTSLDGTARLDFPEGLNSLDGAVFPLAADPSGERVALRVSRGAQARLFLYDLADDLPRPAELAPGALHSAAGWSEGGLRVVYATPDRPADIVTVPGTVAYGRERPAHPAAGWKDPAPTYASTATSASTEWFPTPSGTFEAVCLGDWRTASTVVVALHGGPEGRWTLDYDPVFASLSQGGIAVVAPNQRGSTGYGRPHAAAVHGAWGVPDLADIRSLVRTLTEHRPPGFEPPAVLGVSYGGFLALLAVCADPDAWSRCAVIAPFLSARGLHERATPAVRALIDRHGLGEPPDDDLGPRDVERLAHRVRVPLLAVHGADDPLVPVDETRRLRRRLAEAGRTEHVHFDCLEITGAGHHPLQERGGAELTDRLVTFLAAGLPARRTAAAHP